MGDREPDHAYADPGWSAARARRSASGAPGWARAGRPGQGAGLGWLQVSALSCAPLLAASAAYDQSCSCSASPAAVLLLLWLGRAHLLKLFSLLLQVSLTTRCLLPLLIRLEPESAAGLCVAVPRWA